MGSSPSSQYTAHPSDVRRVSTEGFTIRRPPIIQSRRQSHPGNVPTYAVPVLVPAHLPPLPHPPRQSVPPVVQFSRQDSWNESRDLIFCRILGAEEFLGRMMEQDELLRVLSQRENRSELTPQIVETLGLRGHLQGELVRIERMLAKDDPELKNIANYEISNAAVVEVLREIRDEAKRLRDSEIQTDATEVHRTDRKSFGTETAEEEFGASITSHGVQTNDGPPGMHVSGSRYSNAENATHDTEQPNGLKSRGVATVGLDALQDSDDRLRDVATETDLAELHKQEELELAETFARRIAGGARQLTTEEVNAVLGDHARSVQALKRRQDADRLKLMQRLEQRKMELKDGNDNYDDDDDDDKQTGQKKKRDEGVSRNELGEQLIDENSRTMGEMRRVKDLEKQRIQEMLNRKKKGLMHPVSEEEGETGRHEQNRIHPNDHGKQMGNDPGLDEVIRTLEAMRLSGELSQETMTSILRQYMSRSNGPSREKREEEEEGEDGPDRPRRKRKHKKKNLTQDEDATRDAVQRLVQDNQLNKEEIQKQRLMEKELIERKLQLKLGTRSQTSSKPS